MDVYGWWGVSQSFVDGFPRSASRSGLAIFFVHFRISLDYCFFFITKSLNHLDILSSFPVFLELFPPPLFLNVLPLFLIQPPASFLYFLKSGNKLTWPDMLCEFYCHTPPTCTDTWAQTTLLLCALLWLKLMYMIYGYLEINVLSL